MRKMEDRFCQVKNCITFFENIKQFDMIYVDYYSKFSF